MRNNREDEGNVLAIDWLSKLMRERKKEGRGKEKMMEEWKEIRNERKEITFLK